MAHGQPDYGQYAAKSTVYSLSDLGELAARLGSIVTFDRRGDIIFADDFSKGLAPYRTTGSGTGNSVAQAALHTKSGGFSVKLTAGSTNARNAQLQKYLPYPVVSNLGVEISFTVHADVDTLLFYLSLYDGATWLNPLIIYVQASGKLQYLSSAGAYVDLATGLNLYEQDFMFHTLKYVVDFVNKKYVRCLLDHLSYDMTDIAFREAADATGANMAFVFTNFGEAGKNAVVYADNLIITQNEPA